MKFVKQKLLKQIKKIKKKQVLKSGLLIIFAVFICTAFLSHDLQKRYSVQDSNTILDRNDVIISTQANTRGHYAIHLPSYPDSIQELVVKKEDRFFFYHPGVNPVSIMRSIFGKLSGANVGGGSTITQQLVKILLEHESERTITNKITELIYAFALELHLSKDTILNMYLNSVYLGNQAQGFAEASLVYFDKDVNELSETELVSLLATISSPSVQNPWKEKNDAEANKIAEQFEIDTINTEIVPKKYIYNTPTNFELSTLQIPDCTKSCQTTLDAQLTERLREMLSSTLAGIKHKGATHGAIAVISVPENELIALVGSPSPFSTQGGYQINMATQPRPIGSTIKPFIYAKGFEMGLRPYTQVSDREYKYPVISGFPIYPKNFDGQYQGDVSLHKALSNSLNVPTVKVLEYVGLNNFYDFLLHTLYFKPIVDIDTYAFGIALGGLEMDLLTLTHYFTTFPNEGVLKPISILKDDYSDKDNILEIVPQSTITEPVEVFQRGDVQLINKILSDRSTGIEQFGIKSNLNLPYSEYAVKTGTSRDFHDSWTVGYTPDFVVGVWVGNAENRPLQNISGLGGAGQVWNQAMNILFDSSYYKKDTHFAFDEVVEYEDDDLLVYGLTDDDYEHSKQLLTDTQLIQSPHDGDVILYASDIIIPFTSSEHSTWTVSGHIIGYGQQLAWKPEAPGIYNISAQTNDSTKKESIRITITKDETIDF
ncbi:transglycosylase domain-containing protein [Patescibacteria group bacterium]